MSGNRRQSSFPSISQKYDKRLSQHAKIKLRYKLCNQQLHQLNKHPESKSHEQLHGFRRPRELLSNGETLLESPVEESPKKGRRAKEGTFLETLETERGEGDPRLFCCPEKKYLGQF